MLKPMPVTVTTQGEWEENHELHFGPCSLRIERAKSTRKCVPIKLIICARQLSLRAPKKEGVEMHCKMQLERKQKRPDTMRACRR